MTHQKSSSFRTWVREKWYEHKDEVFNWEHRQVDTTEKEYYNRYKWYLKALYKHEQKQSG